MAFLFSRNRQRSNPDLCKSTKDLLQKASSLPELTPELERDLTRNLSQMRLTLQGTTEIEVSPQQVHQLVEYIQKEDILLPLAQNLHKLSFDGRKSTQLIMSSVLRFKVPLTPAQLQDPSAAENQPPYILHYLINSAPETITALCNGYAHRESALSAGIILREALKNEAIAALILYQEPNGPKGLAHITLTAPSSGNGIFWRFFTWIDQQALFEVSADAHNTFSELLKKHKRLVAPYLTANYALFTQRFNDVLLRSSSYVTQRTSIKLLGELLLDRAHYNFMTRYVAAGANLRIVMNLLRDERKMVSFEAFHVFKIFAANPNKSAEVTKILVLNKAKLLRFLPGFLADRKEDVQLQDEKAWIINLIQGLPTVEALRAQEAGKGDGAVGVGAAPAADQQQQLLQQQQIRQGLSA